MAKVRELWEHPGRTARMQRLQRHGVHERMETAMLARLMLSFVDVRADALPLVLDLFTMFEHPVRRRLAPRLHASARRRRSWPRGPEGSCRCSSHHLT